jgi:DNA processing protein
VDETFDLLTLALLPEVGPRTVRDLRQRGSLRETLARPEDCGDLLPTGARSLLRSGEARRRAEEEVRRAAALGVRIVGLDDPGYPGLLGRIYDPPPVLYVKGELLVDEGPLSVAIVGSRAASPQGTALASCMARELAAAGATIVSGLARGIDTAAHKGALEANGRTVAVLGSGLDRLYPRENEALAAAISRQGAVVSEFPLGMSAAPGHFPRRNRVIAGWGRGVVVVEAAARSGALVTARLALDEGREVFAVPGHPSHAGASGTNQLIVDGAPLARDAVDVARELGLPSPGVAAEGVGADAILETLRPGAPASFEEIQKRSGRPPAELLARLSELELTDRVRRLPGPLFLRP